MPVAACATQINFAPSPCAIPSGGVSKIFTFDPTVFGFTQAAGTSTTPNQPYTGITDLGTASKIYPVKFIPMTGVVEYDQKNPDGVVASYQHKLTFGLPNVPASTNLLANWSVLVDKQGYCCGLGFIVFLNSGGIYIMGEALIGVSGVPIPIPFYTFQNGSKATTGKKMDEQNMVVVTIEGLYNRPLNEYTGTQASLLALSN